MPHSFPPPVILSEGGIGLTCKVEWGCEKGSDTKSSQFGLNLAYHF